MKKPPTPHLHPHPRPAAGRETRDTLTEWASKRRGSILELEGLTIII